MSAEIRTEAELRDCVGKLAGPRDAKVIGHLDAGAARWLAASPLAFVSIGMAPPQAGPGAADSDSPGTPGTAGQAGAWRVSATLAGGAAGFACAMEPGRLRMPAESFDEPGLLAPGRAVGTLFLVPGLGETLRVNGRVRRAAEGGVEVAVEECYMHCAKALIRSDFWTGAAAGEMPPASPQAWLAACRFLALATVDARANADLSPKGDPSGCLIRPLADGGYAFADRPGNRRTDSFLNILAQPRVALLALVPGLAGVAVLEGAVRLSQDEPIRAAFAVAGRTPRLAAVLSPSRVALRASAALARARLWPAAPPPPGLKPAELFAAHVRASRSRGVGAWMTKAAVSVPGLMQWGLDQDYEKNLY